MSGPPRLQRGQGLAPVSRCPQGHDVDQPVLCADTAELEHGDEVGLTGVLVGPGVMSLS